MGKSDKQEQGKNKFSDMKTFPVRFALGEIKENISISTKFPSKPSKEQIFNQAIQFHLKSNIPEAAKYYQHFIDLGFKDHKVFLIID